MIKMLKIISLKYWATAIALLTAIVSCKMLLKPVAININFDSKIAIKMRQDLLKSINLQQVKSHHAQNLLLEIQKEVPNINNINIINKSSRIADINIYSRYPLVIIKFKNNLKNFILTKDGQLVENIYFNQIFLENLNIVTCQDKLNNTKTKELLKTVELINQDIFEKFEIFWHSENFVELTSKVDKKLVIIANTQSIANFKRIVEVEQIAKSKQYEKKGLRADIRFRDYIICTSLDLKGG